MIITAVTNSVTSLIWGRAEMVTTTIGVVTRHVVVVSVELAVMVGMEVVTPTVR